jgi:hypothetical protein
VALAGRAIAGHRLYNEEQREHNQPTVSLIEFVTSWRFGVETAENWQSEFLQFALLHRGHDLAVQRGSAESKPPGEEGPGTDRQQQLGRHARPDSPRWARVGGLRTAVYSNSLAIVFAGRFLAAWLAQVVTGWRDFNEDQAAHASPVSRGPDTWAVRTSGTGPSRTGSRNPGGSARWRSSPCSCASGARPSRSRWARRTTGRPVPTDALPLGGAAMRASPQRLT